MSTGIFNFNLQANAATLRTGNSWSISSNLSPRFNTYPEMNQILNIGFLPTDAVKNISSNVVYLANTTGVFQFFYESNNVVGSITPDSSHFRLSLPINDIKTIDVSADGSKIFAMDSYGLTSSANLSSAWNVATAIGAVSGNTWMKSKQAGQTHSDYYMREDGNKLFIFNNNGTIEQYSLSNADFRTAQVEHVTGTFGSGSGYGYFSDAGDRMFYLRGGLSNITWIAQYNLSESWNVNSASYSTDFSPIDSGGGLRSGSGMRLSTDGLNVYYYATSASNSTRYLHRLVLTSPYDLSSRVGSYSERYASSDRIFEFKDDGTQLYLVSGATGLRSFTLSTPWALSSVVSNTTGTITTRGLYASGISIFDNGSKIVLGSNTSNTINSAYMSPWNISSIAFLNRDDNFMDVKSDLTPGNSTYMRIGADNSNVILCTSRVYYNYRMSSNLQLGTASLFATKDLTGTLSTRADHFTINSDGNTIYQGRVASPITIGSVDELSMSPAWNIASLATTGDSIGVTSSSSAIRVLISNPQNKFTIIDEDIRLVSYTQPTANTLSTAVYRSNGVGRYSSTSTELDPSYGLKFSNDGLYFMTLQSNSVYIHKLSTAWDVSSVTSVSTRSISPSFSGFSISRTGRYVYYLETGRSYINYSQLKRPSDYMSDSFLPVSINFGSYFDTSMYDMEFNNNGTRLLTSSTNGIKSFDNSSTPWLPNGSNFGTTIIAGTGQAMPFAVSRNGKFLYVPYNTGNNLYIRRYTLTTPWVGPATLTQDILIPNAKNWSVYGINMDVSGNILYLLDARSKTVFSYNVGAL